MPIPALAIAAIKIAPIALNVIKDVLGIPPRGNLQKFQRTLFPYMKGLAVQYSVPVFCQWFGDCVGVWPDGHYGIQYSKDEHDTRYKTYEEKLVANLGSSFFFMGCGGTDCVNHPEQAYFVSYEVAFGQLVNRTEGVPSGSDMGTGSSMLIWIVLLLAAGAMAFFFFKMGKK